MTPQHAEAPVAKAALPGPAAYQANAFLPGRDHPVNGPMPPFGRPKLRLKDATGSGVVVSTFAGPTVPWCEGCPPPPGFADGPGTTALFSQPWGLAVDPAGNIIVADHSNNRIRRITPAAQVSTLAGGVGSNYVDGPIAIAEMEDPKGVTLDGDGNIYVAEPAYDAIRKLGTDATLMTFAGELLAPQTYPRRGYQDGPRLSARFAVPSGLVRAPSGDLYVADTHNHVIRKINAAGLVSTFAGLRTSSGGFVDGPAATAQFSYPMDLALDKAGSLYVADYGNHRIRKVASDGTVSTLAGTGEAGTAEGPGATAQFSSPASVATDDCDNLYVADYGNHVIRKITPEGTVSTLAGSWPPGFADGPAEVAQFAGPAGIEWDKSGVLYVSEYYSNRIRKVTLPVTGCGSSLALSGEGTAFSPNGDGSKDTFKLTVTAEGPWTLSVDEHPGTLDTGPEANIGNKAFNWTGKIANVVLPDGKYRLRLRSGAREEVLEVTIDTVIPMVSNIEINPQDNTLGALINAYIVDNVSNGVSSDIDADSILVKVNGIPFSGAGKTYDNLRRVSTIDISPDMASSKGVQTQKDNHIEILASDSAGNMATGRLILEKKVKDKSAVKFLDAKKSSSYALMEVEVDKDVMRPLAGDVLRVTFTSTAKTPAFIVSAIESYSAPPNTPVHIFKVPSLVPQTYTWNGRNGFRPYPAGKYTITNYILGVIKDQSLPFTVDNAHTFDWFTDPKYRSNRMKVIWGRPKSKHFWETFVPPPLGLTMTKLKPNGDTGPTKSGSEGELTIWGSILPAMQNAVGSGGTINFHNIVREKPARDGLDVFYRASFVDHYSQSHLIEVQMNRRTDGNTVKETTTSSYVVR